MNKLLRSIIAISMICLLSTSVSAQTYPDSTLIVRLNQIQTTLLNDQFNDGDSLSAELIVDYPNDPVGHLYTAAIMMARMTDAEEDLFGVLFKDLTEQVISDCLSKIKDPATNFQSSAWYYLWKGHAYAYRALYESRFGSFFQAVKKGMSAKGAYQEGLKLDSTNYDLWFGLGSYHYWKSAKAGLLRWLFVFKNQKDQGIDELNLATDSALVFSSAARSALVWIWLNEEKYDSAITIAEEIRALYPEGKAVLWPLAESYFAVGQYDKAAEVYTELRTRFAKNPGNYFNLIQCDWLLCRTYLKLSNESLAIETAGWHLTYLDEIPKTTRSSQRSHLKFLKRYTE